MGRKMGLIASIRCWAIKKAKAKRKGKRVIREGDELENEELFPFSNLPISIIIVHIMSQLPIKTLAICRLVCKAWNALVSDPYFVRLQLQHASPNVMLLGSRNQSRQISRSIYFFDLEMFGSTLKFHDSDKELESEIDMSDRNSNNLVKFIPAFKVPLRINGKLFWRNQRHRTKFDVVNSCNGLVCLCSPCKRDLIICNPLTGEFINLPKSIRTWTSKNKNTLGNVYDVSFGFQPRTNEYKVLRIWMSRFRSKSSLFVEIYTLGKPGWSEVSVDNELLTNIDYIKFPTCVNGALHWIYFDKRKSSILCFNFENEKFQPFPSPPNEKLRYNIQNYSMAELEGLLYVSAGVFQDSCTMWVMKSYGVEESWTKVFHIHIFATSFWVYGLCWPVKLVNNGVAILFQTKNSFFYFEPENNGYKLLRITEPQRKSFVVVPHIPSLLSLKKLVNDDNNIKVLNVHSRRFKHRSEEDEVLVLKRNS